MPSDAISIPDAVLDYAGAHSFIPKDEYHITVIGKRWTAFIPELLRDSVDELVGKVRWHVQPKGEYYVLRKTGQDGIEKVSIIQLMNVSELDAFVASLSDVVDRDLEKLFPHITLFTKNASEGIGVYSKDEFDEYVVGKI